MGDSPRDPDVNAVTPEPTQAVMEPPIRVTICLSTEWISKAQPEDINRVMRAISDLAKAAMPFLVPVYAVLQSPETPDQEEDQQ